MKAGGPPTNGDDIPHEIKKQKETMNPVSRKKDSDLIICGDELSHGVYSRHEKGK